MMLPLGKVLWDWVMSGTNCDFHWTWFLLERMPTIQTLVIRPWEFGWHLPKSEQSEPITPRKPTGVFCCLLFLANDKIQASSEIGILENFICHCVLGSFPTLQRLFWWDWWFTDNVTFQYELYGEMCQH